MWSADGKRAERIDVDADGCIMALAYHHPSKRLALGTSAGTIVLVSTETWKVTRRWTAHKVDSRREAEIVSLAFSNDGTLASSAEGDKKIKLWSKDGPLTQEFIANKHPRGLAFQRDGKRLFYSDSGLFSIDLPSKKVVASKELGWRPESIAFSPKGDRFAVEGKGDSVCILDTDTLQTVQRIPFAVADETAIRSMAWSSCGRWLAWSHWGSHSVCVYDLSRKAYLIPPGGHFRVVTHLLPLPKKKMLITAGSDGLLSCWELGTGKLKYTVRSDSVAVTALAVSPEGESIATGGIDRVVSLWKASTGQKLHTLRGHERVTLSLAFSPDGTDIFSTAEDGTLRKWNCKTGRSLGEWPIASRYSHGYFAPGGKWFASYWPERGLRLDEVADLVQKKGQRGRVFPQTKQNLPHQGDGVAFSPGGDLLAYCDRNEVIHVVDPANGAIIDQIDCSRYLRGVCCLAVGPKGEFVAAGSPFGQILVWDRKKNRLHATWKADPNTISALAFTEDGKSLVSSGSAPSAILWSLEQVRGKNGK